MKPSIYSWAVATSLIIVAAEGLAWTEAKTERGVRITIERGDRLWKIAEKCWGQGIEYKRLLTIPENLAVTSNPDLIFPGMTFLIPSSQEGRCGGSGPEVIVVDPPPPPPGPKEDVSLRIPKELHEDLQDLSQKMECLTESLSGIRTRIEDWRAEGRKSYLASGWAFAKGVFEIVVAPIFAGIFSSILAFLYTQYLLAETAKDGWLKARLKEKGLLSGGTRSQSAQPHQGPPS